MGRERGDNLWGTLKREREKGIGRVRVSVPHHSKKKKSSSQGGEVGKDEKIMGGSVA